MLDTTGKDSKAHKREGLNALSNHGHGKTQYIKVEDHIVDIDKRSFGLCCQAEQIKAIFTVAGSIVFPYQTNQPARQQLFTFVQTN